MFSIKDLHTLMTPTQYHHGWSKWLAIMSRYSYLISVFLEATWLWISTKTYYWLFLTIYILLRISRCGSESRELTLEKAMTCIALVLRLWSVLSSLHLTAVLTVRSRVCPQDGSTAGNVLNDKKESAQAGLWPDKQRDHSQIKLTQHSSQTL